MDNDKWEVFGTQCKCVCMGFLMPKMRLQLGAPDAVGGAYNTVPDPLAGVEGACCPLP